MQPRPRRRFVLNLDGPEWDGLISTAQAECPEGFTLRDMLLEYVLRGSGIAPRDAALFVARRAAFSISRIEASALLADLGRRLTLASREAIGSASAELQALANDVQAAQPPEPEPEPALDPLDTPVLRFAKKIAGE